MFIDQLKNEANYTTTENGALTHISTQSHCLDLFATIGALRTASIDDILNRFYKAYAEDRDLAMKILFYARDIRGGLGERDVFRVILSGLGVSHPESVNKNLAYIPEFGRWDDVLCVMNRSKCEKAVLDLISLQLSKDGLAYNEERYGDISLLAKWLPSINTSNKNAVRMAKHIAKSLHYSDRLYRKTLSALREKIRIIENNLREKDYTFDYSKQPSKAMLKYRKAFIRNDRERYDAYLEAVAAGKTTINTGTLYPYDIVREALKGTDEWGDCYGDFISEQERKSLDVSWNALEDFTNSSNSMVILDGSGSMYCGYGAKLRPIDVAMSLAIYFAEHTTGYFHNHFITFSAYPKVVEINGADIVDKVRYCAKFNDCSNTNLASTFDLLLKTAVKNNVPQSELPETLYIISDMEFDCCRDADVTNFQYAKKAFEKAGYKLPNIVFWNVCSRNDQQPVTQNEQGVALVSGSSPRVFQMVISGETDPYKYMESVIMTERYAKIRA